MDCNKKTHKRDDQNASFKHYELTPVQRGLLFHALQGSHSLYAVQATLYLKEAIDLERLQHAWNEVIHDYEVFGFAFLYEAGKPVIKVTPERQCAMTYLDFSEYTPHAQETHIARVLQEDQAKGWDLSQPPLLRLYLIKLEAQRFCQVCSYHHLLFDGYSGLTVFQAVLERYKGILTASAHKKEAIQPLVLDYFAQSKDKDTHSYWDHLLQGVDADFSLRLPVLSQPGGLSSVQNYEDFSIPTAVYKKAKKFARSQGVTLAIVTEVVWCAVLAYYSDEDDVVLGMTHSLPRTQFKKAVNLLVNTLPVRCHFAPSTSVLEVLQTVKQQHKAMKSRLHSTLKSGNDTLIKFAINYMPLSPTRYLSGHVQNVTIEHVDFKVQTHYQLLLELFDEGDALAGRLNYATDKVTCPMAQAMLDSFEHALNALVDHPDITYAQLRFLTKAQIDRVVTQFNQTDVDYDPKSLVNRFEAIVARAPNQIALSDGTTELTYEALNRQANRWAHGLRAQGVVPHEPVGIYLPRSIHRVVATLAVFKLGAVYFPISTQLPEKRVAWMCKNSKTRWVLGLNQKPNALHALKDVNWLDVLAYQDTIETCSETNLAQPPYDPDAPSYLIYTSGSTGEPKGVLNRHGGTENRLRWMQKQFRLTQDDRVLHKTSAGFDVSVWEILWPLISGARLVLAPVNLHYDALELCRFIKAQHVTVCHFVPSMLAALLSLELEGTTQTLRWVIASGEALPKRLIHQFYQQIPNATLFNLYGPTEASIDVSYFDTSLLGERSVVPIGQPIDNTQLYVLDKQLRPLPVGVIGELYIGGQGVALGYYHQDEMTQSRFIENPFSSHSRLYKTGDLAYWLEEGLLTYAGRIDRQVKLRGQRIELSEIEHQLTEYDAIKQAIVSVVTREVNKQSQQQLVAFVCIHSEQPWDKKNVVEYLTARLPAYMVPQAFCVVKAIPLTRNGKADYLALERLYLQHPERSDACKTSMSDLMPLNEKERIMANIWKDVLHIDSVRRQDHFFELGGDSILSIQIASHAQEAGLKVRPQSLFDYPTLEALSHHAQWIDTVKISNERTLDTSNIPLTPAQQWFFQQSFSHLNKWNQAIQLDINSPVDRVQFKRALETVVNATSVFYVRFKQLEGHWVQYRSETPGVSIVESETLTPASFDITSGPIAQITLINHSTHPGLSVHLVAHHLFVDAVSWTGLLKRIHRCYEALMQEQTDVLEAIKTSMSLDYFSYADNKTVTYLKPHGVFGTYATQQRATGHLSRKYTQALIKGAFEELGTSIEPLLVYALGRALADTLGEQYRSITMEHHGRDRGDNIPLYDKMGWFTTFYSISADTSQTLNKWVEHCRASKTDAHNVNREQMLSSVLFNYLGQLDGAIAPDWTVSYDRNHLMSAPENQRPFKHEINVALVQGQLTFEWLYSNSLHSKALIDRALDTLKHHLRQWVQSLETEASTSSKTLLKVMDAYPVTSTQKGVVMYCLAEPEKQLYVSQVVLTFSGHVNRIALNQAWHALLERHTSLRTAFHFGPDYQPIQRVYGDVESPIRYVDANELTVYERLKRCKVAEREAPFNLQKPPLVRLAVVELNHKEFCLVYTCHHSVLDGWSNAMVLNELVYMYRALDAGQSVKLPEVRLYRDYVLWKSTQDKEAAKQYWHSLLWDFETPNSLDIRKCELPKPLPKEAYQHYSTHLSVHETSALNQYARKRHVTVNSVLQAAWALVVSMYARTHDVVFGAVISGRAIDFDRVDRICGLLVQTLPLRIRLKENETLRECVSGIQQQFNQSRRYTECDLSDIYAQSAIGRTSQLFDTAMVYENYPHGTLFNDDANAHPSSWTLKNVENWDQTHYPLSLIIVPGKTLKVQWVYDTSQYANVYIKQCAQHFMNAVNRIVENDEARVGKVNVLSGEEQTSVPVKTDAIYYDFEKVETQLIKWPTIAEVKVRVCTDESQGEPHLIAYCVLNDFVNEKGHALDENFYL